MKYVLVLITVFSGEAGVDSETAFQEFESREACERAADAVRSSVNDMKGTLGRDVIAQCHPLGKAEAR